MKHDWFRITLLGGRVVCRRCQVFTDQLHDEVCDSTPVPTKETS